MNIEQLTTMLKDKYFFNLKKMGHKYSNDSVLEMIDILKELNYKNISILDFVGNNCVYQNQYSQINSSIMKKLLISKNTKELYGLKAMEDEINASLKIENIYSNRDSIKKILSGYAPENKSEEKIYAMKKGLDFISDISKTITEENLYKLYMLTIGDLLEDDDKLIEGTFYRHDTVYVMGDKIYHEGINSNLLPKYMQEFINFINQEDNIPELTKASIIHFYFVYLHPYFDGNGRIARLLHLWYLVQQGFSSTLFYTLSEHIVESKKKYYDSFLLIENNFKISNIIDITPFIVYFNDNVYSKIKNSENPLTTSVYTELVATGKITEKERDLWAFVLTTYGNQEFSTKMLERDFYDVAYATVRSFVLKFEELGLLTSQKYSNRVKYRVVM